MQGSDSSDGASTKQGFQEAHELGRKGSHAALYADANSSSPESKMPSTSSRQKSLQEKYFPITTSKSSIAIANPSNDYLDSEFTNVAKKIGGQQSRNSIGLLNHSEREKHLGKTDGNRSRASMNSSNDSKSDHRLSPAKQTLKIKYKSSMHLRHGIVIDANQI